MSEKGTERIPDGKTGARYKSVVKRIIIVAVFLPCLIIIARRGGVYFLVFVDMVIIAGLWEFYTLVEQRRFKPYKYTGILVGALIPVYIFAGRGASQDFLLGLIVIALFVAELFRKNRESSIQNISITVLGIIYIGFLGSHLVMLRELPLVKDLQYSEGALFVILVFVLTWLYDTGAYTVGMIAGRHKLLPRISPGKTLEGTAGGVIITVAGILVARRYIFTFLGLREGILLAITASAMCQFGDLAESMIKREMRAKDSSSTLPGHGGILDRFDSMLFSAPVLYYLLKYVILK
jgi:phosphatidate cytidylyltransferase